MSDQNPTATPAPEPVDAPDLFQMVVNDYERQIEGIVQELRRTADRIEAQRTPPPNQKNPGFGNAASMVVSDLTNLFPNLGMSGLVRAAAAADVALLHERAKTPL